MAIRYLSNLDLTNGELQNFKVQNLSADPSVTGEGQLIYRSDSNVLKYYDGSAWQILSTTTGTVTSVGLSIDNDAALAVNPTSTPVTSSGTLALEWQGGAGQVVRADGSLGVYATGTMSQWQIGADSGTNYNINNNDVLEILGTTGRTSTATSFTTNPVVTVDLATTAVTAGSYTSADITVDAYGRITAASDGGAGTMSSWILAGDTGTNQTITDGNTVTISGDGSAITTTTNATDTIDIGLRLSGLTTVTTIAPATDFLVGVDGTTSSNEKILYQNIHLNQWGDAEADVDFGGNKLLDVATGTAGTDGVNLAQVQSLVAGVGVFQGGYDASTNTPALTGASNVAMTTGDFYAVTTGGSFFTETLEVGDLIFANVDIAANSSPTLGKYTIVQSGQSIADAGATDGATTKGITGFDSANFQVSGTGWTQLKDTGAVAANVGGASKSLTAQVTAKGLLNSLTEQDIAITSSQVTDFCTAVETCVGSNITFADTIGDGVSTSIAVTHNLGTRDVIVQLYDNSSYDTIRAEVVRNTTNQVTITTNTAIATNDARVLITKVA